MMITVHDADIAHYAVFYLNTFAVFASHIELQQVTFLANIYWNSPFFINTSLLLILLRKCPIYLWISFKRAPQIQAFWNS